MKLIIIGAGASYDCISEGFDDYAESGFRPPLANELLDTRDFFRTIIDKYPGVLTHLSEVNTFGEIEDFFQQKWDYLTSVKDNNLLRDLINIQYYLSELFLEISHRQRGLNNYHILLRKAYEYSQRKNENVIIVSFNYDTILDEAFEWLFKSKITHIDDYIRFPIKLIKPHGSCNWFNKLNLRFSIPPETNSEIASAVYRSGISLSKIVRNLDNEVKIIDNTSQRSIGSRQDNDFYTTGYFPRLLLPFKAKDEFVLPPNHLMELKRGLEKINEILIIGWKAGEKSFLNLLNQYLDSKQIKIHYVTGCDKTSSTYFKANYPLAEHKFFSYTSIRKRVKFRAGGFSAYINEWNSLAKENPFKLEENTAL